MSPVVSLSFHLIPKTGIHLSLSCIISKFTLLSDHQYWFRKARSTGDTCLTFMSHGLWGNSCRTSWCSIPLDLLNCINLGRILFSSFDIYSSTHLLHSIRTSFVSALSSPMHWVLYLTAIFLGRKKSKTTHLFGSITYNFDYCSSESIAADTNVPVSN